MTAVNLDLSLLHVLNEPTESCRLVFLRHPELEPSFTNRAVGGGDATLGRRGQQQVLGWLDALAELPVSTIYSSPQAQCLDAARAVGTKMQVDVQEDERLRDQAMGDWEGQTWDEIVQSEGEAVRDFFGNFGEASAPSGESLGDAVERMLDWWKDIAASSLQRTHVVVTSGGMISGFAAAMLGMRLSRSVSLNLPFGGIGVLDCFANGVRIAAWNPGALEKTS